MKIAKIAQIFYCLFWKLFTYHHYSQLSYIKSITGGNPTFTPVSNGKFPSNPKPFHPSII